MYFILLYFILNTILTLLMFNKIKQSKVSLPKKADRLLDIFLFGTIFLLLLILSSERKK
jgi:glucan phosphoethanolaminetransferase (alkaline phosphatase superfamily)